MGSHNVTCYPTQGNTPRLNPSPASWLLLVTFSFTLSTICTYRHHFHANPRPFDWKSDALFWPVKTVSHITYTVLVDTLNHAQSIDGLASHYLVFILYSPTTEGWKAKLTWVTWLNPGPESNPWPLDRKSDTLTADVLVALESQHGVGEFGLEPSPSHRILVCTRGFAVLFVSVCTYCIFVLFVYSICSFSTVILLVGSFDL